MSDFACDLLSVSAAEAERLRARRLGTDSLTATAERWRLLGDPVRLTLLDALAHTDSELCVCDLAWISERADNLVSHHLRALRAGGLVASRRDGKLALYAITDLGRQMVKAALTSTATTAGGAR
jgi:DNA-binding transcriptional ArsR family regulator